MFIPDPGSGFFPSRIRIPDPGVKKAPDPDPQHWTRPVRICKIELPIAWNYRNSKKIIRKKKWDVWREKPALDAAAWNRRNRPPADFLRRPDRSHRSHGRRQNRPPHSMRSPAWDETWRPELCQRRWRFWLNVDRAACEEIWIKFCLQIYLPSAKINQHHAEITQGKR